MSDTENNAPAIGAAFTSFEETLKTLLKARAQQCVNDALKDLSRTESTFQITGVDVDITISNLSVSTAESTHRRAVSAAARRPGRRAGGVRRAVMDVFSSSETKLTPEEVGERLEARGVTTNMANLHQHLGRLVKAGELQRPHRGVYQRRD